MLIIRRSTSFGNQSLDSLAELTLLSEEKCSSYVALGQRSFFNTMSMTV
jgi:hypothetical protein